MKKRILSLLLLAAMAASLLVLPAQAAPPANRFYDLGGDAYASVESLRLMGVMDGYSDGNFRPYGQLTRAQFCKMVVCALNAEDELGLYRTVTVYPDVKPSHWAAAYINMASKGKKAISGFSDGKFYPDRTVTLGQAATILLRVLGYKDENIGGVWPDSYLSFAASIGLTDGVDTSQGNAPLNRSDAAILFNNLLRADVQGEKGSSGFLASAGLTTVSDMVLVSSNARGPDGKETAMLFSDGSIYQMAGDKASNGSLNGLKGTLVLEGQKVRTFLPDAQGISRVVTVAKADATQITDRSGVKYAITGKTKVYRNGAETSWAEARSWVNPGTSLTLYLGTAGNVEFIFIGGGDSSTEAVIVYEKNSVKGFDSLTGGVGGYTIYKNGCRANAKDMRPYDVATYASSTNTIRVCDTRLTGFYESCTPSPTEPVSIRILGNDFDVLPTAQSTLAKFRPGEQITLLLTEDNKVAGAVKPGTSGAGANAIGIATSISGTSATVKLLCGIEIKGTVDLGEQPNDKIAQLQLEELARMQNRIVRVTSTGKNTIGLARLSGGVSGALDLEKRRLGASNLAETVSVFRYTASGIESLSLTDLGAGPIPNGEISYAHTNWAGQVDVIVLGSTGRNVVVYGRTSISMGDRDLAYISIYSDQGQVAGPFRSRYDIGGGVYVAAVVDNAGTGSFSSLKPLAALKDVPNSAWSGESAVTVDGRTYSIPSTVMAYNRDTHEWISASEGKTVVDIAHAYAKECDMYASEDGVIRAIEVGGGFR
nr:S-layer homology domain-containing protein [uncultured Oscillibacter sp.]